MKAAPTAEGLLIALRVDPNWPGCKGVRVYNKQREKYTYVDCGECPWCLAQKLVDEWRSAPE